MYGATVDELQTLLKYTYGIVPILAGFDKLAQLNLITDWAQYLAPQLANTFPGSITTVMITVGVIEVIAGILILTRWTREAAYIVAAWLTLIAVNLVMSGMYYDIAVRDLVLAVGAYTLAQLTAITSS